VNAPKDVIVSPKHILSSVQPSASYSSRVRIVEIDFHTDKRYEEFLASHAGSCIFHQPGWLNALEMEYGAKCVLLACENPEGNLEGVMPLLYTRGLPFPVGRHETARRLSSLPRSPLGGPVSTSKENTALLLRAALEKSRAEAGLRLEVKTQVQLPTDLVDGLVCTIWRPTYVLEIPNRPEDLKFGDARNRHNINWAVKKAIKQGLKLRVAESESELRAWYRLYLETMRRNVVPPRPLRLFMAMWKNLAPRGSMQLQLAEQHDGGQRRLVAGSIFLTFGGTVWYAFTGVGDADRSLHANDLILWDSINNACRSGARWFDLGEVAEEHPELVRFKTKWGAQPKNQYRYYSNEETESGLVKSKIHTTKLLRSVWQHLPLQMTARLGDWLYSRL
jgi:hypothetical protein